jgi:vacuolar-type H+-ATPase subunit F/Vma7
MELMVKVLCTPRVAAGFTLAGVNVEEVDEGVVSDVLRRLSVDETVGIILVEDTLHRALPDDLRGRLDRLAVPIVVPFPSPSWERRGLAEQYVLEILRQAVGYRVRAR